MIKSNFLLLSQGLNRDNITKLASVFNILERLGLKKYPAVIPPLYLTTMIERDDISKDHEVELEAKLLNNKKEIKSEKKKVKFDENLFKHKRMIVFNGIKVEEPGKLIAKLYCNGEEINGYDIDLKEGK